MTLVGLLSSHRHCLGTMVCLLLNRRTQMLLERSAEWLWRIVVDGRDAA